MLDAMDAAERVVRNLTVETFVETDAEFAALCYYILIVSEASRHIADDRRASFPAIPWRDIADTGNFVRHVYFRVNRERVWNIYDVHFPRLRPVVEKMIAEFAD